MKYINIKNRKFPIIDSPEYPYLNYNGHYSNLESSDINNFDLKFNNKYFNIKSLNNDNNNILPLVHVLPNPEYNGKYTGNIMKDIYGNIVSVSAGDPPYTVCSIMPTNFNDFEQYLYTCSTQGEYGSGGYDMTGMIPDDTIDITKPQIYSIAWHGDRKREIDSNVGSKHNELRNFKFVFKFEQGFGSFTIRLGINKVFFNKLVDSPDLAEWNRLTIKLSPIDNSNLFSISLYVNGELIDYSEKNYGGSSSNRNEYWISNLYPFGSRLGTSEFCIGELEFLNTSADLTGTKYMRAPQ